MTPIVFSISPARDAVFWNDSDSQDSFTLYFFAACHFYFYSFFISIHKYFFVCFFHRKVKLICIFIIKHWLLEQLHQDTGPSLTLNQTNLKIKVLQVTGQLKKNLKWIMEYPTLFKKNNNSQKKQFNISNKTLNAVNIKCPHFLWKCCYKTVWSEISQKLNGSYNKWIAVGYILRNIQQS